MRAFAGLSLVLAAACAPLPPPYAGPPYGAPPPSAPPYGGPPPMDDMGQCGAPQLQWLVGRDRLQIPPPQPGRPRRVYAYGDALTMDFSPARLNIEYDGRTGRVLRVYCG